VQKEADRILLARYVPPSVLVNAELEILQFRGDTGPYLSPAPGKASLNLLRMVRPALEPGLRAAILRARKANAAVRQEGLPFHAGNGTPAVDLEVVPVPSGPAGENGFLILFEKPLPAVPAAKGKGKTARPRAEEARRDEAARLTAELAATREYLQSVIEQQEAANEELQSANEEAQSANEELQSVNEELETSKEEIQSSNEELATVNDELQNRNAEQGLLNNDLFNLLSSIETAIVILGRNGCIRRFTPMAEKVLNLIPADIGRPIAEIRLNLDLPDLQPLLKTMFETGSIQDCEVRGPQGTWYSLRIRPYKTLENQLDGAVVMLVDIDRVRRARDYAESIVATVREPLLVLDADLCVQTASQAFYQAFQVTAGETEKRFLYDLGDGQWDLPELRRLLEEMPAEGSGLVGYEVDREFARIGRRTLLLNARRLFQEDGRSALTLLALEDITARKGLETALNQRVDELAAADRSKNEFLALLAHELRNPLAPLRNAAHVLELADAGTDLAVVEAARGMLHRQIQNMSRLIEDLLDVSRITGGRVGLRLERVVLAIALRQAVELVRHLIEARGQELSLSLPSEPVFLHADPLRLEQVFGNLLNNASKFTPEGGHLWLTAELPADAPGEVVVRVRDDGIGMAAETLPQVFGLFVQAERSYDRGRGGLGIGLTVVHRLVELHGGRVEAGSDGLGKGSELVVHLPVLAAEIVAPALVAPPTPRKRAAPPPRGASAPRRVLVVDDNVDSAESMALLLSLKGYEVATAHDGPAALVKAAAFHPEAVLLDIGLPGLDGYQVATRLRGRRRTAKSLLVALTGYGQEEDRNRALQAGFDHHLTKPVDPQAIYDLLAPPRP
jgi:two-component system CheB/CheR fusion protein